MNNNYVLNKVYHSNYNENTKSDIELQDIAGEVFELLKTKNLPFWQFEEVFTHIKGLLSLAIVK